MVEVVSFVANDRDRDECIRLLRDALARAEAGHVQDVAIVLATRTADGPMFERSYHGDGAYAVLVCGVADLAFHLQYARYIARD